MHAALRTFAGKMLELETPVILPEPMPGPCEPIDSVAHRRLLRDMLAYKDHADDARLFVLDHYLRWSRLSEQIFRVDKWSLCLG
jgi:hypothetical protein